MEGLSKKETYTAFLKESINNVGAEFYKIKTTYSYIVRERVFCYELYHQMRILQNKFGLDSLSLSAEIDKRGHRDINIQDQRNPDFVFHKYGTFSQNEIVIEVKGKINRQNFKKDFETLDLYYTRYNYRYAYFILYNYGLSDFKKIVLNGLELKKFMEFEVNKDITIICKKDFRSGCEIAILNDLIGN